MTKWQGNIIIGMLFIISATPPFEISLVDVAFRALLGIGFLGWGLGDCFAYLHDRKESEV